MSQFAHSIPSKNAVFCLASFAAFVDSEAGFATFGAAGPFDPPTPQAHATFQPAKDIVINTTEDLLHAERITEAMVAAGLTGSDVYWAIVAKAKAYFASNPALLWQPWVHSAGTFYDLHETLCREAGTEPAGRTPADKSAMH